MTKTEYDRLRRLTRERAVALAAYRTSGKRADYDRAMMEITKRMAKLPELTTADRVHAS